MSIAETTAVSEEAKVTSIFCRGTRPAFQPKAAMTEGDRSACLRKRSAHVAANLSGSWRSKFRRREAKGPANLLRRGLGAPLSDSRPVFGALCRRNSVLGFCDLRLKMLLFRSRRVHGQGGNHNRVASCGNHVPVGDKAAKYAFTVGDELLAKLKRVIHARLPSLWSLRACDHRSAQNSGNQKHDCPLHRQILPAVAQL